MPPPGRIRQPGAGRKRITEHDPRLAGALERLMDPDTRGDSETPLRWTCKSTRTLAAQLPTEAPDQSHEGRSPAQRWPVLMLPQVFASVGTAWQPVREAQSWPRAMSQLKGLYVPPAASHSAWGTQAWVLPSG